jgi:integrase
MSCQRVIPVLIGEAYENLFGALKSQETKTTYAFRLKAFLSYMNMHTPHELLSMGNATAQKKIIGYILYLKNEKKLSYSSLEGVCAPLKKFYAMNDVVLNWDKIHAYLPEHEKTIEDKEYSREQIKRLLQFATKRPRVTILLLASSGLRRGALPGLRKKHLTYIKKYGLYQITTYPKAKERYVTFCTPECATEIKNYFDYRRSCGEVIDDESPVIRDAFDRHNLDKVRNPKPVSNDGFKFMLEGVVTNAGLKMRHENVNGKISQRTEIMLSHGLRKFFDTNLSRARLHTNKLGRLMGHLGGLQHRYDKSDVEELLEEYVKAIDLLTINDENRLKAKVATFEDKDRAIQDLTKTVEEMRTQMQTLSEKIQSYKSDEREHEKFEKEAMVHNAKFNEEILNEVAPGWRNAYRQKLKDKVKVEEVKVDLEHLHKPTIFAEILYEELGEIVSKMKEQ